CVLFILSATTSHDILTLSLHDALPIFIAEYEHRWENRKDLLEILQHIKQLVAILQQSGSEDILVDLGRVKNQPYYSGMMFRGFLPSSGVVCFSGGRYDRLYEQFGNSVDRKSVV